MKKDQVLDYMDSLEKEDEKLASFVKTYEALSSFLTDFDFMKDSLGLTQKDIADKMVNVLTKVAAWPDDKPIPGAAPKECGNYKEHDLKTAKEWAAKGEKVVAYTASQNGDNRGRGKNKAKDRDKDNKKNSMFDEMPSDLSRKNKNKHYLNTNHINNNK